MSTILKELSEKSLKVDLSRPGGDPGGVVALSESDDGADEAGRRRSEAMANRSSSKARGYVAALDTFWTQKSQVVSWQRLARAFSTASEATDRAEKVAANPTFPTTSG